LSYTVGVDSDESRPAKLLVTDRNILNGATGVNPPAGAPTDPACLVIGRNPISGGLEGSPAEVSGLFAPLSNLGKLQATGVDATINYRRDLGTIMGAPAKFNLSASGNHTIHAKFQATPTSLDRECAGFYSVNCGPSAGEVIPKWTANTRGTLSFGRVDLSLLWRYIHKVKFEPAQLAADIAAAEAANVDENGDPLPLEDQGCPNFETDAGDAIDNGGGACLIDTRFRQIKAHHYFDLSTRFNVNEHFDLTFTVMNLLDKDPPVVGGTIGTTTMNGGNTYPSTYDPLGRRFAASARIKF
jgi:outer membrane receptor protein involved in Fe transport